MEKIKKKIVSKMLIAISLAILIVPTANLVADNTQTANAKSIKMKKCIAGYTCYKMNYYITPAKTKSLAKQTKKLNNVQAITNFIGLAGLNAGILSLTFGTAVDANNVFKSAAKKGKGVQVSYIHYASNTTTVNYNRNAKYVIK